MISVYIISFIGLLLSVYAVYIEKKITESKKYHSVCDISNKISCSKTFTSGYGKLFFGISNGVVGILFYALAMILTYFGFGTYVFYLASASVLGSIYLAYVLSFKVKTVCIVCYSIYAVNLALFFTSYFLK